MSGELVPWTHDGYVDQQRELTIAADRGKPTVESTIRTVDTEPDFDLLDWLDARLEPDPQPGDEPGDDR